MALVAKVTGWPPAVLEAMREGELAEYAEFALRMHGVKPDATVHGGPPPASGVVKIPFKQLSTMPTEALLVFPLETFQHLTPAELRQLPPEVQARLVGGG